VNGLVRQEKGKMQLAVAGAGASLKRPREASAVADAEKRRFKVDFDLLECPICSEPFVPPVYQVLTITSVEFSPFHNALGQTCEHCQDFRLGLAGIP
jgi:hypothetical protein